MDYDFSNMKIGDRIILPVGGWSDTQREVLKLASDFCNTQDPHWQFQTVGHEGSDFERGQYWLERTR